MMSVTCNNLGFGRTGLEFVASGFSSNVSSNRVYLRNCAKGLLLRIVNRGCKARKLWCFRPDLGPEAFLNGVADVPPVLDLTKEREGSSPLTHIFELVAADILTLNKNLNSNLGPENSVIASAAKEMFEAGGKKMRPTLIFLVSRATAEMAGLKDLTEEHRKVAEIIEIIHTASLIHDDMLDESETRRGKGTIHQVYGAKVALLVVDFMFALSSVYLSNLENRQLNKLLSKAVQHIVIGEMKQASTLFNCDVQMDEYLIKNCYKTSSLIAAGTEAAAICSGVNLDIAEQMHQYGKNLGQSFQLINDILDFTHESSDQQLGKPPGSDLAQGNLTAPVIFALEKDSKLRGIIESKFRETGSLEEAVDIVNNSGGIDRARELARDFADQAIQNLHCLPPSSFRLALERMVINVNLEQIK